MNTDSFHTDKGFLIVYSTDDGGEQSYRLADIRRVIAKTDWCPRWDNYILTFVLVAAPGLFAYFLLLSAGTIGGFLGIGLVAVACRLAYRTDAVLSAEMKPKNEKITLKRWRSHAVPLAIGLRDAQSLAATLRETINASTNVANSS